MFDLWSLISCFIFEQFIHLIDSVDSILLVEEGFDVTSVDASDKMLKYALKLRWLRRKEPPFDKWGKHVINANVFLFQLLW